MTLSAALDERTTLARPDLAEQALEGIVRASAFRAVQPMHCRIAVADLFVAADATSERIDQLIFGEAFDLLERREGLAGDVWAWGRARRDGAVGWVRLSDLGREAPLATHRIASAEAALPMNALIHHPWSGVSTDHLKPVGDFERDPVAVAEILLGTPHSLGARSSRATDCSGLVQQAFYACGMAGPRHSDQQVDLGRAVGREGLRRGDVVVWLAGPGHSWTGHSALAVDGETLIHATGHHGAVVIEALAEAEARYAADGFQPPVFRRLS